MGEERNRIILQEAEAWRQEGRITESFHGWLRARYPVQGDAGTQRILQRILVAVAGILVLVGIFTLVAEFWSEFTRVAKLLIMLSFALAAGGVGLLLGFFPSTRLLSHGVVPLALPLYLFATQYVSDPVYDGLDPLLISEGVAVATALLAGLAGLLLGLWRYPGLALASGPTICFSLIILEEFTTYSRPLHLSILWTTLGIVLLLHTFYLLLWSGVLRLGFPWMPFSARLGWAANVPFGFASLTELVYVYAYPRDGPAVFDTTYVGVPVTAAYVGLLLFVALRLGLPELTVVCGAFLVGDALWLGGSKGGVLGAVLAIFLAAIGLAVLAQQGVLKRIFRPQAPRGAPLAGRPQA